MTQSLLFQIFSGTYRLTKLVNIGDNVKKKSYQHWYIGSNGRSLPAERDDGAKLKYKVLKKSC